MASRFGVILVLSTVLLAAAPLSQAEQPVMVNIKRMSMETALKAAQATIAECRKQGVQVAVTVVDRGGHAQVVLRDVLAPDLTLGVSYQKAYTAVSFLAATSALGQQAKSPLAHVENMFFGAGGLPIQAGGQFFGGVGVSGAPGGDIDEECAKAGIDAIVDDLEMSL